MKNWIKEYNLKPIRIDKWAYAYCGYCEKQIPGLSTGMGNMDSAIIYCSCDCANIHLQGKYYST